MTIASQTATTPPTSPAAPRTWLFPGKLELALVVNWGQATVEAKLHDLMLARELERARDLTLIARLRLLSAECSKALALCRAEQDAA